MTQPQPPSECPACGAGPEGEQFIDGLVFLECGYCLGVNIARDCKRSFAAAIELRAELAQAQAELEAVKKVLSGDGPSTDLSMQVSDIFVTLGNMSKQLDTARAQPGRGKVSEI